MKVENPLETKGRKRRRRSEDDQPLTLDRSGQGLTSDVKGQRKASWHLDLRRPEQLVDFCDRTLKSAAQVQFKWRQRAEFNLAWISGQQDMYWMREPGGEDELAEFERDPRFERPRYPTPPAWSNYVRRYVNKLVSRIAYTEKVWRVTPRTGDEADVMVARALDRMLPLWWDQMRLDRTECFPRALHYLFATSIVYARPMWVEGEEAEDIITPQEIAGLAGKVAARDPDLARSAGDDDALFDKLMADGFGVSAESLRRRGDGSIVVRRGKLAVEFYSGFEVFPDPVASSWDDVRWVRISRRRSVAEIHDVYGSDAAHVVGDRAASERVSPVLPSQEPLDGQDVCESTVEHVIMHRRCEKYPDGLLGVVIEDRALRVGENPYAFVDLPLVRILENPDCYERYPTGVIDDVMTLQAAANKVDQQIGVYIDENVDPEAWAEQGSWNEEEFDKPSPHIRYFPPGSQPPQYLTVPPLGPYIERYHASLIERLRDIADLTQPSVGQPDVRLRSGRAIALANERSDMLFAPTLRAITQGMSELGEHLIAIWAQYEPEMRSVALMGEDRTVEFETLKGETMVSRTQNAGRIGVSRFDVKVSLGDVESVVTVIDKLSILRDFGMIDPNVHGPAIQKALGTGVLPDLDTWVVERVNATEENETFVALSELLKRQALDPRMVVAAYVGQLPREKAMEMNIPLVLMTPGDHHPSHVETHKRLVRDRRRWNGLHPAAQALLGLHIQAHEAKIVEAMAAMASPGAGSPPSQSKESSNGRGTGRTEGRERGAGRGRGG